MMAKVDEDKIWLGGSLFVVIDSNLREPIVKLQYNKFCFETFRYNKMCTCLTSITCLYRKEVTICLTIGI